MSLNESQWFTEIYDGSTAFSVRLSGKLLDTTSEFQRVEVFDTEVMGKVMILNGCFMVTEKDSFVYHEMLVHPAMNTVSNPRNVLVIGGGDGGAVTEIVKYPNVESVILCEIDEAVIDAGRKFFPEISAGLADPRVKIVCEDGAAFVRKFKNEFDVVLVDSTDPVGPGTALFELSFYHDVRNSLTQGGAAVYQTESPFFMEKVFVKSVSDLRTVFGADSATPYFAIIPSYPGGLWSFTFCSNSPDWKHGNPGRLSQSVRAGLNYYSEEIHRAAFALPPFCERMLRQ